MDGLERADSGTAALEHSTLCTAAPGAGAGRGMQGSVSSRVLSLGILKEP